MKIVRILCFLGIGTALLCSPGWAGRDRADYILAVRNARAGYPDFAFMYYRTLLRDYPQSRYADKALFAKGEYYFSLPDYSKAASLFRQYLEKYPDSKARLFALAYLLKIARSRGQADEVQQLEKDIITSKQVGLVFSDRKQYPYRTPLYKKFRAVFRIDTIEFYVQEDLFEKISY